MTCYLLELEAMGWRVQLGYDRPLRYYFVSIAEAAYPEPEPEAYIYHNLHTPEPFLAPLEVEEILAVHGIGLPYDLARLLMEDGIAGGYPEAAARKFEYHLAWELFCERLQSSSPDAWQPRGMLPDRWYRLHPK